MNSPPHNIIIETIISADLHFRSCLMFFHFHFAAHRAKFDLTRFPGTWDKTTLISYNRITLAEVVRKETSEIFPTPFWFFNWVYLEKKKTFHQNDSIVSGLCYLRTHIFIYMVKNTVFLFSPKKQPVYSAMEPSVGAEAFGCVRNNAHSVP